MSEVLIWVQTDGPATVEIVYWPENDATDKRTTDPIETKIDTGFVAKSIARKVKAGTRYSYEVRINGESFEVPFRKEFRDGNVPLVFATPPNWRFRKSGHEVPDFTIGFGSCAYVNEPGGFDRLSSAPYGADYRIFEAIYEKSPDVFIWLGDNVYYREPDWTSKSGMIHRWAHDRSIPEMRPLLATVPNYSIWDDHDYGPNNAGREYWNKALATEVFSLMTGNASAGLPETPGIFTFFNYGDVNVYLTDNRTNRTVAMNDAASFDVEPTLLGKAQVDWLVESMKYRKIEARGSYPSTFNLICMGGQALSLYGDDSYLHYKKEFQYLLDRLVAEGIENVIFLTGDVHYGEMNRLVYKGGGENGTAGQAGTLGKDYVFYEITSSPLTAGPWPGAKAEDNPNRYDIFPGPADRVGQRNFATLSFEGPLNERRVVIRYFDSDGKLLNARSEDEPTTVSSESILYAN